MIELVAWLCLTVATPEGSYLTGHTPTYSAGVQVHTLQVVPAGCSYYYLQAECTLVYDRQDTQFRTTYLCTD